MGQPVCYSSGSDRTGGQWNSQCKKGRVPFHLYPEIPDGTPDISAVEYTGNPGQVSKEPLDAYNPGGAVLCDIQLDGAEKRRADDTDCASSVSVCMSLSFNTPMTEILDVLKRLHFPGLFIELMLLTYRFIFILMEGASAIMTAQKARLETGMQTFDPVFPGQMASVVFVRALKQSDALYNAMGIRCYDGEIRHFQSMKKTRAISGK